ncbi:MAG: AAA family ATPase, partial [Myxococcales bacterium]
MNQAAVVELFSSGREQELELLTREYEQSRTRACARFAFVHGPAGIGKSYLMRALRRSLASRGIQVFEGAASRALPAAYGLVAGLVPALLDYLGELGIPGRVVAELSRRVGPLCGGEAPERLSPEERRLDLYDALAELFSLASAGSPCFLLADADAADRASLEVLRYLAASALAPGARSGGLFVISYRDDAPLPTALAELVSRLPALNVPLCGLDLDGIRAFLARRDVAERLLESTGGLPTALEEVVAGRSAAPADLFERRLANFSALERAALLALAVHGEPADSRTLGALLARAFGMPADGLDTALERLVRERLIKTRPLVGASVHTLARSSFRDAVLARARPEDVASVHAALGELLSERGADPQAIARHFLAAEPRGRGALEALRAADALVGRAAFDEAAELYRLALEALPQAEKAPVRVRLARALRGGGDYSGAIRELALARRALEPAEQRAALAEAATLAKLLGRLSAAELLCRKVLDSATSPDDGEAAKAFVTYADVLFLRGKYAEARAQCERGIEAHAANPELAIALRNTLGKTLLTQGAYEKAAEVFAQNAALAHEASLPREEARALINQGIIAHRRGDRRGAVALYHSALTRSGADRGLSALALSNLGSLYADSAELEPAVDHLSRALSAFTRAGRSKEVAHCALNLARLHLFLGDLDRAGELCDHAAAVAGEVGDPYLLASADLVRGEWLEASGSHAKAVELLEKACEAFVRIESPRYAAESALALARAHLAHGDLGLARGALALDSLDAATREPGALAAERDMIAGEIALLGGDLPEATRRLSNAKELLLEHPDLEGPYRVYHLLARLRAAAGDAAGAAAHASRAAQLLEELATRVPAA